MAKKGQAVQFQTEVTSDEEWEKLLERKGLIVVDVYSDWCGPCSGMAANLKKLKLEVGGDMLQLAIAKTDNITCLERFRDKSEPTWMFISDGKMVNLMYGANAPKLMRLITEELRRENEKTAGTPRPDEREITDLADEERVRVDAELAKEEAARLIREAKRAQQVYEWRVFQANHILETSDPGIIWVLPKGRPHFSEVLAERLPSFEVTLGNKDKVKLKPAMLEEILYFADGFRFPKHVEEELLAEDSVALLVKPGNDAVAAQIDDVVLEVVYGSAKAHPGSPDSPAQILAQKVREAAREKEEQERRRKEEEAAAEAGSEPEAPPPELGEPDAGAAAEEEGEEEEKETICIWAPPNRLTKAYAFKNLFYNLAAALVIPEPEPTPPHVAVGFDAFKRNDVLALVEQFPQAIMRYGFFTSDDPKEAQLIAKSVPKFEKKLAEAPTHTEKMVVQLSQKRSDAYLAFVQLGPSRMSTNPATGEEECKIFFPEGYDVPEEEVVEEEEEVRKKPSRKRGKRSSQQQQQPAAAEGEQPEAVPEEGGAEEEAGEGEPEGADKATSPMQEEATEAE